MVLTFAVSSIRMLQLAVIWLGTVILLVQAAVFQLKQQHWRLSDAAWRLVYLLQKANDTAASLTRQVPRLGRRLTPPATPEGSLRPRGLGHAASNMGESGMHMLLCLSDALPSHVRQMVHV